MTRKGNYWTWVQWKNEIKKEKRKTCCCCGRMWSLVFHSGARAGWSCSSLPGFFVSELIGYFKWYLLPVTILLKNYYLKWCSKTHIYFVCFYSPPHSRHFLQRCWRPTPWSCTPWKGGDHSLQNGRRQFFVFRKKVFLCYIFPLWLHRWRCQLLIEIKSVSLVLCIQTVVSFVILPEYVPCLCSPSSLSCFVCFLWFVLVCFAIVFFF